MHRQVCASSRRRSSGFSRLACRGLVAVVLAGLTGGAATAQVTTFLGAASDWSAPGNWSATPTWSNTTDLVFTATSSLSNTANATNSNNVSSGTIRSMLFNASGYTLTGNSLFVNGAGTTGTGAIANQSTSGTVTINLPLTFRNSQQTYITGTAGSTTVFGGNLTGGTNSAVSFRNLNTTGTSTWVFNGASSLANSGTVEFLQNTHNVIVNSASAFGSAIIRVANTVNFDNLSGTAVTLSNYLNNPAGGLIFQGSNPLGFGTLNATRSGAGDFTFTTNGSAGLSVSAITTDNTVPGSNSTVPNKILKGGTGTLVISGSSNYSIPTFINGGTLLLGNVSALGSGTLQFGTTAQLGATTDLTAGVPNRLSIQWSSNARTFTFTGSNSIKFFGNFDGGNGNNTDTSRGTFTFSNSGTSLVWFSGTTMTLATTVSNISNWFYFNGSGNARIDNAIMNASGSAGHSQSISKNEAGILTLTNSNSYSGTTALAGGVLRLNNEFALPGGISSTSGSGVLTISGSGVLGLGAGDFSRPLGTGGGAVQITTGGGFAAYGSGLTRNVNFGGGGASVTWGAGSFMTTAGGTFTLGHATADGTVDFKNPLVLHTANSSTNRTIRVARGSASIDAILSGDLSQSSGTSGLIVVGGGVLSLTGNNSFKGKTQVNEGTVQIASLADSGNSPLGTNATLDLGSNATAGTLRWVGGAATIGRTINLNGSTGGGTLDASGSDAVTFSNITVANTSKTLNLIGTSTAANSIGAIPSPSSGTLDVVKDGPGRWRFTATNTFTGAMTVRQGTLELATSNALFGSQPVLGGTATSGTAALLINDGITLDKVIEVPAGSNSQRILIGSYAGGSGTATFTSEIFFDREVRLVAANGGQTAFTKGWLNTAAERAAANVRIGTADYGGAVILRGSHFDTAGTVGVDFGRLDVRNSGTLSADGGVEINGSSAELKYNSAAPLTSALSFLAGTLSGTGTINTPVTSGNGTRLSPGNSPGTQAFGSGLTLLAGGTYAWEINDALGTKGADPGWDLIDVTGGVLNLSSLSAGSQYNLDLITLNGLVSGSMAGYTPGAAYTWQIFRTLSDGVVTSSGTAAAGTDLTGLFNVSTANWASGTVPSTIQVKVSSGGTGLDLVIVPEPAAILLAGMGVALAGWTLRRRRRSA